MDKGIATIAGKKGCHVVVIVTTTTTTAAIDDSEDRLDAQRKRPATEYQTVAQALTEAILVRVGF